MRRLGPDQPRFRSARTVPLGELCPRCNQVHPRCAGHKKRKVDTDPLVPCMRWPDKGLGLEVCKVHGGNSPNALKGGQVRVAWRLIGEAGGLLEEAYGEVQVMTGPEQVLDGILYAGAMARSYRWLLGELPIKSEWSWVPGGTEEGAERVSVSEEGWVGPDARGQQRLHAYEEGARHWTKLHADLLAAAHKMGIEEANSASRQEFASSAAQAIRALVAGLGRDLDDPEVVPVVEGALRLIAGGRDAA